MRYKTLLFDLDGTIINTNELIINSFLFTLDKYFPKKYNREMLLPHLGKTLYEQMELFGGKGLAKELVEVYREHNLRTHDDMVTEFPFVKDVLYDLYSQGYKLGIVTTKVKSTALMGLRLFELDKLMSIVIGYEDTKKHKPDPAPIYYALECLKADPKTTLMVGDSQYDIEAANDAGITSIGVGWSLKGKEFINQFNPDYMIDDIRELISIVRGN